MSSTTEGSCLPQLPPSNGNPRTSSSPFVSKFNTPTTTEVPPRRHKRMKVFNDEKDTCTTPWLNGLLTESKYKREKSLPNVFDYFDPFSVPNLAEELDHSIYGSVAKDIEDLRIRRLQMMNPLLKFCPSLSSRRLDFSTQSSKSGFSPHDSQNDQSRDVSQLIDRKTSPLGFQKIIDLDDDYLVIGSPGVENSELVCKPFAENIQGYGCENDLSVNACHVPKDYVKTLNVNEDLQIIILDSDEEESADQSGTYQDSRYNLEALNLEVSQAPRSENCGKGLITHSGTIFHKVHGDQHGVAKHTIAESVHHSVLNANQKISFHYQEGLKNPENDPLKDFTGIDSMKSKVVSEEQEILIAEAESTKDKGVYVGVQVDIESNKISFQSDFDGDLGEIWREMTMALECNKDATNGVLENNKDDEGEKCDHSFVLKDDLGYVCRVCGVISKSIDKIFDYQWLKGSKTTRTSVPESWRLKEREEDGAAQFSGVSSSYHLEVIDIYAHPRHMKQMKSHQLEGFNFLVKNLISDDPGGCILAHAPGSGKTFMIISFIQTFLAKFPDARPLVVLPKGIVDTWRKEFIRWQVEEIPLYDFYSSKAKSREDQLDVLNKWFEHKGILFLGYKQFANIVSKSESSTGDACHDMLLKVPQILIMDEGHNPRNEDTDILSSLGKVKTPRKVVLSGTLFQNRVKEVFNILNLVRPRFLKLESSKVIRRRVMSRGQIGRKQFKAGADAAFFDVVEVTLQDDENIGRKVAVIRDLREMTGNVLHYYKGDFLDELPGLVDITVFLNLSPKQKYLVDKLKTLENFKRTSIATAVYVHPQLKELCENATLGDRGCKFIEDKINHLIDNINFRDGVKTKFFLNILGLCESSGEKLLVFSQYLLPLKFLERLLVHTKGWSPGKEIFGINGDTSPEDRDHSMECFNNSSDAKVFFGSIKACGEGISLVGASRILIMDVHLNPSVTRQAIGRAFRPGQISKVYVYRLVASDSPEEENHATSLRKELISKMWFEWNEYDSKTNFEMETVNVEDIRDKFWASYSLREDVNIVKKR